MNRRILYRFSGVKVAVGTLALLAGGIVLYGAAFLIAQRHPAASPALAQSVTVVNVDVPLTRALRGCLEPQFKEGTVTVVCGDENERAIVVHYPDGRTEVTHVVPRSSRLPLATPTLPRGY